MKTDSFAATLPKGKKNQAKKTKCYRETETGWERIADEDEKPRTGVPAAKSSTMFVDDIMKLAEKDGKAAGKDPKVRG